MAESDLDTELRRAAEATAESILSAAREESARITSEAAQQIDERRSAQIRDKEAEYGGLARASVAAEKHDALQAVLVAQTTLIGRVLARARSLLPEMASSSTYLSELPEELREALQFVGGDSRVVRCSKAIEPVVRDTLREDAGVSVELFAQEGTGFVVVGGDGSVMVDGRLDSRIDRLAPSLAIEIHKRLEES
ncbi:MAG: V-type ATP synthase subunit E [Polyangiales bacterium]